MTVFSTGILISVAIYFFIPLARGGTVLGRFYTRIVASAISCIPLGAFADSGGMYIQKGMQSFSQGKIAESIKLFDEAELTDDRYSRYLWQRGIAYYYNNEFSKAKNQFEIDAKISPSDTEERLWAYLCNAKLISSTNEENSIMTRPLPDRRNYMNVIYEAYHDGKDIAIDPSDNKNRSVEYFYLNLYAGLLEEARGNPAKSLRYVKDAVNSVYAKASRDYMVDVAKIHLQLRGNM